MKIARKGIEYIELNEKNLKDYLKIDKIHLIKLNFEEPTEDLVNEVLKLYPKTNRFVVSNNIKVYNDILKKTTKKYYIENGENNKIFTFFRKNNKVLFNFTKLNPEIQEFLLNNFLYDIIKNVEVIEITKEQLEDKSNLLDVWAGNVILH